MQSSVVALRVHNIAVRDSNGRYEDYPSIVELAANPDEHRAFYGAIKIKAADAKIEDMPAEM